MKTFKKGDRIRLNKEFLSDKFNISWLKDNNIEQSSIGKVLGPWRDRDDVCHVRIDGYLGGISNIYMELVTPRGHPLTNIFK